MKVLYFHQHFSTREGTTGTRSYEMAIALRGRGHEVTMVCGTYDRSHTGLGVPFERGIRRGVVDGIEIVELELPYSNEDRFLVRSWTFIRFAWKGIRFALTERYDVLFATSTPLTAGLPGIFARWLRRKPFVFEVRDLWPELPRAMGVITNPLVLALMSALEWASYKSADLVIGLAPGIVDGVARRGIDSRRIVLIPNGCDLDLLSQGGREAWRPEGVGAGDLMAVYAGTHGIANGLDAVLDAAAELKRRGRGDIKLVLVGDGMLKPELQARAVREGLNDCVFVPPVPKSELAGLLHGADVGMMILADVPAFYYGTSPNKFFDYIAAGLPVVTNYPGWIADLVAESECGTAVPPRDASALADALAWMADHRGELAEMGRRGRQLAEARFDRQDLARRFLETLEEAAKVP